MTPDYQAKKTKNEGEKPILYVHLETFNLFYHYNRRFVIGLYFCFKLPPCY